MTALIKHEYIGNNVIRLSVDKIGVYEVTKARCEDKEKGLYRTDLTRRTASEKSAKSTYNYYKRIAKQEG